ncbi:radical SAM family heme chaperone HemW [Desulfonatronospira sp.]|uniref:radical SAM family heme chaperone HemW n=1 Tax=Desulfonatronospira sp. TaxID=1962951 RepID=UPI0025BE3281|nr:radical SAM family heme chaperone HemW [Desulfonatronospira sp.]
MLLYVHVPFCRGRCAYCAFASQEYIQEPAGVYLQLVQQELQVRSRQVQNTRISSIYIGGGTPTVLPQKSLARIVEAVYKHFDPLPGCEFTLEANPENIQGDIDLKVLASMGINRISLGIQSLDDQLLKVLERGHDTRQALKAMRMIREAGFARMSLDLIWGIPGQTLKGWLSELAQAVQAGPDHLSCYGLGLEPGTRLTARVKTKETALPGERTQARMYMHGAEYLESCGYLQYEISNFAVMGFGCKHNMGYWAGEPFLGVGPSAVSSHQGVRWRNPSALRDYQVLGQADFRETESENLSHAQQLNELVLLSLRTSRGLNLNDYKKLSGVSFSRKYADIIQVLHRNNLIRMAHGYLRLTRNGMLVSNSILEKFME